MIVTRQIVADKIADYLHHRITLAQLVDWAEKVLMDNQFDEKDAESISVVAGRLGVADVRAFGLTWDDCEELMGRLGFSARIEIVTA